MAIKNQSITVCYTAWDTATNVGKTGDVANHTIKLIQDGTANAPTNSPSEVDATNAPGVYKLVLAAGDINYNTVTLAGKSSTSGVVIIPIHIITESGNFATVEAKTNNLPASPAAVGSKMDIVDAPSSTGVGVIVSAIWDKLLTGIVTADTIGKLLKDNVNATISSRSSHSAADVWAVTTRALTDKAGFELSATGLLAVADAILKRDWTQVTGESARSVLNALRFLRNKWAITGTTMSVKKEDDSTEAWNAEISTTESANYIIGIDPA